MELKEIISETIKQIADGLLINFGGQSLDFKRVFNKKLKNK